MSVEKINITLGTAGHIDHGKTALVKCLTGCETDRLKAEKERGMSIDLGFAPCKVANTEIGIVDVPGHENFIKTMVAGAAVMDGVMLIVAADDGVMPQTREHLDVLSLLGVRHGLVVLTKIDRVESDLRELVLEETQELLRDTFLAESPIVPFSSVTGQGFDILAQTLTELVQSIPPKPIDGLFRLPVDRAFTAKGYGTVVAGVPVSGSAHIGDEVLLLPHDSPGRIKRIQVYGSDSDTVMAGQCAAINVAQWEHRKIERGHIVTVAGYFTPHQWHACSLQMLSQDRLCLKTGARVKFYTGTAEVLASVYATQGTHLRAGDQTLVQVKTDVPVIAAPGDRFILRSLSPVRTIGGGTIIESLPTKLKRNRPQVLEDLTLRARAVGDDLRFVEYCLCTAPTRAARAADLARRAKLPVDRVESMLASLAEQGRATCLASGFYIHHETAGAIGARVLTLVAQAHHEAPDRLGLTLDELRQSWPIDKAVLQEIVAGLIRDGRLVEESHCLALPEHRPQVRDEDHQYLDVIESLFREGLYQPPTVPTLTEKTGASSDVVNSVLKILIEREQLVEVAHNLLFHRQAVEQARAILIEAIRQEGRLESVRFKYLLDTTRKFAIPLLDYFDRVGITRKVGHTRYLRLAFRREG